MSNILPFSLKLSTHQGLNGSAEVGTLRVSSDGRVRVEDTRDGLRQYLSDMAEKLNKRVVTIATMGPDATGRFDSWNRVVEHDDPDFPEALKLQLEGEYGLIAERAA